MTLAEFFNFNPFDKHNLFFLFGVFNDYFFKWELPFIEIYPNYKLENSSIGGNFLADSVKKIGFINYRSWKKNNRFSNTEQTINTIVHELVHYKNFLDSVADCEIKEIEGDRICYHNIEFARTAAKYELFDIRDYENFEEWQLNLGWFFEGQKEGYSDCIQLFYKDIENIKKIIRTEKIIKRNFP